MNKQQKKMIIIAIIAILIIVGAIFFIKENSKKEEPKNTIKQEEFTTEGANGNKVNTSEELKKERQELGYYLSNITLEKQNAQTIFKLKISNQGKINKKSQLVDIIFLRKNGEEEARMSLYIREINAGESITTQATINNDFTNVYNFKLQLRTNNQ